MSSLELVSSLWGKWEGKSLVIIGAVKKLLPIWHKHVTRDECLHVLWRDLLTKSELFSMMYIMRLEFIQCIMVQLHSKLQLAVKDNCQSYQI